MITSHFERFWVRFALLVLFRVKKTPAGCPVENSPTERYRAKSKDNLLVHLYISGSGRLPELRFVPSEDMFLTYPEYFFALRIDTRLSSLSTAIVPSSVQKSLGNTSTSPKKRLSVFALSRTISLSTLKFFKTDKVAMKISSLNISSRSNKHLRSSSLGLPKSTFNFRYLMYVCLLKLERIIQNVWVEVFGMFDELFHTMVRNPLRGRPSTDLLKMVNSSFRILANVIFSLENSGDARWMIFQPDESLRTKAVNQKQFSS